MIVVAEGAGDGVMDLGELKENVKKDESGNPKLPVKFSIFRILAPT